MCFWLYFGLDFRKAIAAFVDLRRRKFENNDDKHVEHFYFSNCVLSFLYRRGGGGVEGLSPNVISCQVSDTEDCEPLQCFTSSVLATNLIRKIDSQI